MREDCLHVPEFLLESGQHLLAHLELHSARMVLDGQRILAEVLDKKLILPFVLALAHLQDHVFVTLCLFVLLCRWSLLRGGLRLREVLLV